ncbi:hypothetical protein Tco_0897733 [Tanacetum coccineum]
MILNDPDTKTKQLLVKTNDNQSVEINDLKVQLQDKLHVINELKHLLAQKSQKTQCELPIVDSRIQKIEDENISENNKVRAQLKGKVSKPQKNHNGTSVNTKLSKPSTYSVTPLPKSKVNQKNDLSKSVNSHLTTKKIIKEYTKFLAPGRVNSTNASGSKLKKNDRIPQPLSRSMKNKVEAHHRKFKSSANKNNHVSDCNANVKNVALLKNSDTICLSCNECLFSANHDACVVQYLKKTKKRKVAKSAKQKVKSKWKPTRWIFKIVGLKWIPTGRTFNLVGKTSPLPFLVTHLP